MTKENKTTDASKVELTDEQMDGAQGGAGYLKIGDIPGESRDAVPTEELSLNFTKVEFEDLKTTRDDLSWKVKR